MKTQFVSDSLTANLGGAVTLYGRYSKILSRLLLTSNKSYNITTNSFEPS